MWLFQLSLSADLFCWLFSPHSFLLDQIDAASNLFPINEVYGKHAGHKCELATNIATSTREELRSLSKRLGDYYDIVKKARKKVIDSKDAILNTQQYLRKRIMKHMGMLRACMARREAMLKCEVDSKTTEKLKSMDAQESDMTEIIKKCDLAYSLIQKCQNNDSALVEEKNNVYALVDEVASSMEKCELEPKACDNLTYYFEYDIACTLETKIGEIRMLKPGQKEEPLAGLYAHELSGKKQTKEAGSQTENWDNDHPLFESLLHGLEEIVHTGLTAHSWQDESPLQLAEEESSDDSPSEPASDQTDGAPSLDHSTDNNSDDGMDDDDDDDAQLVGAVGGLLLPAAPRQGTEHRSSDEEASRRSPDEPGLLNELQKEIERLRLLGPRGNVVRLTNELSGSVTHPDGESDPENEDTEESRVLLSSPNQQATGGENFSLDSKLRPPEQRTTIPDGLSLDSTRSPEQQTVHCSAVNCQFPEAPASLKCRHCKRVYCTHCAPLSFSCSKKSGGHRFVSTLLNSQPTAATRSRRGGSSGHKKAKVHGKTLHPQPKEEGLPWECNHCTMLNGAQVLVCLGCDTLRDSDARDGRNVCPMCTLLNERGNVKCELCDTELVSQEQASSSDPEE